MISSKTLLFLHHLSFLKPIEKYNMYRRGLSIESMLQWSRVDWEQQLQRKLMRRGVENSNKEFSLLYHTILQSIEFDIQWARNKKGWICYISDDEYPELLRHIPDPPLLLYGRGNKEILSSPCVSIVGTRKPDAFGIWATRQLAQDCLDAHITVVSGLAYGIDVESHRAISDKYGTCIVVLGTSIDNVYPRIHRDIAMQILRNGGAIISETAPIMNSAKYRFITRNRIITGLSLHTVIVQAPKKSGALASAEFALEQGRSVLVHRAGIQSTFMGTIRLWQDGASMCMW